MTPCVKILLLNKPYGVLSQFTDNEGRPTLAEFIKQPNVYACGRLDRDSEGLLVLSNNGRLQHQLAASGQKTEKIYWVQVERIPEDSALAQLRAGVYLKDGLTRPARIEPMPVPQLWSRTPPVRFRKNVPDCWLKIGLGEGRNRQVRRMTAAVGHPTLRLVRVQVGPFSLGTLAPGEWCEVTLPVSMRR